MLKQSLHGCSFIPSAQLMHVLGFLVSPVAQVLLARPAEGQNKQGQKCKTLTISCNPHNNDTFQKLDI